MPRFTVLGWSGESEPERDPDGEQAGWEATWPAPRAGDGPYNTLTIERWLVIDDDVEDEWRDTDLAVPVVDGTPLFEQLGNGWPGIAAAWSLPPSRQWLGSMEFREYGRSIVLDGTCGVAGCCGVIFRIMVFPETVVWDQPYCHGGVDIPVELRFEFDRAAYEAAVAAFGAAEPREWRMPPDREDD